jgi:hypothetical protein
MEGKEKENVVIIGNEEVSLDDIEDSDSTAIEMNEDIQLEENVKTVLKLSDLCSAGDTLTLYNARHARKGRMDKLNELSLTTMNCFSTPQPHNISWFLAMILTASSAFFVASGVLLLIPLLKEYGIFFSFIASLAWTVGGFLSYFEVINSVNNVNERFQITRICVLRPQQVDWWIGILNFLAALCFQISFLMISFLDPTRFSQFNILYAICLLMGCSLIILSSVFQIAEGSGKARCLTWNPREPWFWSSIFFIIGSLCWIAMCILDIFIGLYFISLILYTCGSSFYFIGSYALIIEVQN